MPAGCRGDAMTSLLSTVHHTKRLRWGEGCNMGQVHDNHQGVMEPGLQDIHFILDISKRKTENGDIKMDITFVLERDINTN